MQPRSCNSCGTSYTPKRASSKYCSDTCRVRGSRGIKTPGGSSTKGQPSGDFDELSAEERRVMYPVTTAVSDELVKAERFDSAAGQLAVALALRVDSPYETGAAVASLAKQLDAAMDKAMRGARVAADPLDELRRKREQKLAAG